MARTISVLGLGLLVLAACGPQLPDQQAAIPGTTPSTSPTLDLAQLYDFGAERLEESQAITETCIGIDDPEQVALGHDVYGDQCAECHGPNGEGQFGSPFETDAQGRLGAPPHDDTGHTWHHDDELLMRIVREGGTGDETMFVQTMPAFGEILSDREIEAVIAYIKTLWSAQSREIQCSRS